MPEEQPTSASHFDFGVALQNLKGGNKVTREGWNGPGQYVFLKTLPEGEVFSENDVTVSYAAIRTTQGHIVPWVPSQTDMLATDWRIYA